MRMLIAGATGYVGRHAVAVAAQEGDEVIAHCATGVCPGERALAELAAMSASVGRTARRTKGAYYLRVRASVETALVTGPERPAGARAR